MQIVTAAIIKEKGRLLIAKRKKGETREGKWEFPGGKLRKGEQPKECLKRELREELGVDAYVGKLLASTIHHYKELSINLLAYEVNLDDIHFTLTVHDEVRWERLVKLKDYDFTAADVSIIDALHTIRNKKM